MWQVAWGHPKFGNLIASASFDHRVIIWKEGSDGSWAQVCRKVPVICSASAFVPCRRASDLQHKQCSALGLMPCRW